MTNDELQSLKLRIKTAEDAYESLMLGRMPRVVVDQNGERVEFTATNRGQLALYIGDLRKQLPGAPAPQFTKPIGFIF